MSAHLNQIHDWQELAKQANWSASGLAKLCGVSVRTLERHFIKTMDKNPKIWLVELRQIKARELLNGGSPVKEIAHSLNYKHPSHLTKDFKKFWGLSPSAKAKTLRCKNF